MADKLPEKPPDIIVDQDSQLVSLAPFEEIRGRLERLNRTEQSVTVQLSSGVLRFPAASEEATIIERELAGSEGQVVAILRLPAPNDPLGVRID